MLEPVLDWHSLTQGRVFNEQRFTLDDAAIDAYLLATGETHPLYERSAAGGFAPPLFTTLVRFVKGALGGRWPSGTVQLDHRLTMTRALRRGETLSIDARCGRTEMRNGRAYFEIVSTMRAGNGEIVGTQSTNSIWGGALLRGPSAAPQGAVPDAGRAAALPPAGAPAGAPAAASAATPQPGGKPDARIGPPLDTPATAFITAHYPMARIQAFGEIAGALDPIHVDPEFGRSTRYGVNIVQGRLVMTLLSRLMLADHGSRWLAGASLDVRFVRPVLVDESITARSAPAADRGQGFVVWCENARGERVIEGTAALGS